MADITAHQLIASRRRTLLSLLELRIGALLFAMSKACGLAFEMAFVAPFETIKGQSPAADQNELEGRDPNW